MELILLVIELKNFFIKIITSLSFCVFYLLDGGLAREVEELGDLGGHGGHDGSVEECVETGEEERTDDNSDKDLYAGIDVAFASGVGDCGLCGNCDGVELVGDGVKELFHRIITSFSFCFLF